MSLEASEGSDQTGYRAAVDVDLTSGGRLSSSVGRSRTEPRIPIDFYETPDHLVVIAALPGVSADDLQVTATDEVLTIAGTIPSAADQSEANRWTWYLHEIPHGPFRRTIDLPVEVNPEAAQATFQDGLLHLTLPKCTTRKSVRLEIR